MAINRCSSPYPARRLPAQFLAQPPSVPLLGSSWGVPLPTSTHSRTHPLLLFVSMALPPILNVGSKFLKDKIVRDVVTGRKHICLAISEPGAGSDVAAIAATAIKSPDGKSYGEFKGGGACVLMCVCAPTFLRCFHSMCVHTGACASIPASPSPFPHSHPWTVVNGQKKWITGAHGGAWFTCSASGCTRVGVDGGRLVFGWKWAMGVRVVSISWHHTLDSLTPMTCMLARDPWRYCLLFHRWVDGGLLHDGGEDGWGGQRCHGHFPPLH